MQVPLSFFNQDAQTLAKALLGKVLMVKHSDQWLQARIIETEAYYLEDKASHASLGYTEKRKALFMAAGTIYMYHSRAGASLNVSAKGDGNAVLIKSAVPYEEELEERARQTMLSMMHALNPKKNGQQRPVERLCSGQALLCRSLGLKISDWDAKQFDPHRFYIRDVNYAPQNIIVTTRLGIASDRDPHLLYRFIDSAFAACCTKKPKSMAI
ncbi:MAG: 3-methyladenine glycosylase [Gammaproteobacteria bacterium]|jgi:DNA-3-methyladenine glycosylase|nr:3-methyladenine glycosylase [Gammaproteobacteria bacterium]